MKSPITVGELRVAFFSGGELRIDGGNMFGVIPRLLWERKSPPDAQHRIRLDTNCMLIRTAESLGLVDTGYGGKSPARFRQRYALEDGAPLERNLSSAGIRSDEIDWVILTHLHFDHAGGATYRDSAGRLRPTFSRARHYIQRAEWEDALADLPELAGSYHRDDFAPLADGGLIELLDGDCQITPGVSTELTGGHTRGHQIVRLESAGQSAVCLADLCPTAAHLPPFWTMAYDQFPLDVRRKKRELLADAAEHHRAVLFSHDPDIAVARVTRDLDDEWSVAAWAAE